MPVISSTSASSAAAYGPADVGAELAELAVRAAEQDRRVEQDVEQTEESMAEQRSNEEIHALRQKADDLRFEGLVDGGAMIGVGVLDAASAGASSPAGPWYRAGEAGLQGASKISDSAYGVAEEDADATSRAAQEAAARADQSAKDAHDAGLSDDSSVTKALDAYSQFEQAQASVATAILRPA